MENRGLWQWASCNPIYARAQAYKPLNMPYSPYFSKANSPTKTNKDFQQRGFTLEPFHIVTWTEVSKKFSHIRWKDVLHFILSLSGYVLGNGNKKDFSLIWQSDILSDIFTVLQVCIHVRISPRFRDISLLTLKRDKREEGQKRHWNEWDQS